MKKRLRLELLPKRLALSPEEWSKRSRLICETIVSLPEWKAAEEIALYKSFRQEVDLHYLLELSPQKKFYYPLIDAKAGAMEFYRVLSESDFRPNSWGLLEPGREGELFSPSAKSLIIVPALAFDRHGHRLGYGKGFYDRYLQRQSVFTLGVCFHEFLLDVLPRDSHDRPVDCIVSDEEVLRPAP